MTLTSVHPYLRWSDGGTTIWATAGSGHGSAENERVRYGLQEESALGLRLGLVEVRRRLATVGGGVELQLRGDASWARLTTAAGDELIDALGVDVHQLRVGIDVSRTVRTAGGTLVEPFGEVHSRRDGGSGQTGAGLEVAGGLRVARGVFRVEGLGRLLALHAADGYREHGGAVTLSVGDLEEPKAVLFQSVDPSGRRLTGRPLQRRVVLAMIKRRATGAGLPPSTCCHTFRATGITAYLSNGGTLEHAQQIAGHASPKTTKLYDRTADTVTVHEIERIVI